MQSDMKRNFSFHPKDDYFPKTARPYVFYCSYTTAVSQSLHFKKWIKKQNAYSDAL